MFVVILGIIHGFNSDVVECWLRMLDVPGSIFGRGKRYLAIFHLLPFDGLEHIRVENRFMECLIEIRGGV